MKTDFAELRARIKKLARDSRSSRWEMFSAVAEVYDGQLWRSEYRSWNVFAQDVCQCTGASMRTMLRVWRLSTKEQWLRVGYAKLRVVLLLKDRHPAECESLMRIAHKHSSRELQSMVDVVCGVELPARKFSCTIRGRAAKLLVQAALEAGVTPESFIGMMLKPVGPALKKAS